MLDALDGDTKISFGKVDVGRFCDSMYVAESLSNLAGRMVKHDSAGSAECAYGDVVPTKNLDGK